MADSFSSATTWSSSCFGLPARYLPGWRAARDRVETRVRARVVRQENQRGPGLCPDSDPGFQRRLELREEHEQLLRKMGKLRPGEDYDDWLDRQRYLEEMTRWLEDRPAEADAG